jgi:hypothetical protein
MSPVSEGTDKGASSHGQTPVTPDFGQVSKRQRKHADTPSSPQTTLRSGSLGQKGTADAACMAKSAAENARHSIVHMNSTVSSQGDFPRYTSRSHGHHSPSGPAFAAASSVDDASCGLRDGGLASASDAWLPSNSGADAAHTSDWLVRKAQEVLRSGDKPVPEHLLAVLRGTIAEIEEGWRPDSSARTSTQLVPPPAPTDTLMNRPEQHATFPQKLKRAAADRQGLAEATVSNTPVQQGTPGLAHASNPPPLLMSRATPLATRIGQPGACASNANALAQNGHVGIAARPCFCNRAVHSAPARGYPCSAFC